jgi:hypothetical protein
VSGWIPDFFYPCDPIFLDVSWGTIDYVILLLRLLKNQYNYRSLKQVRDLLPKEAKKMLQMAMEKVLKEKI